MKAIYQIALNPGRKGYCHQELDQVVLGEVHGGWVGVAGRREVGYTLTHMPSGYSMAHRDRKADATALAKKVVRHPAAAAFKTLTVETCGAFAEEHPEMMRLLSGLPAPEPEDHELEAYKHAQDAYLGWCDSCEDYTREMTEPDAQGLGYRCPVCGGPVVGADIHLFAILKRSGG